LLYYDIIFALLVAEFNC